MPRPLTLVCLSSPRIPVRDNPQAS